MKKLQALLIGLFISFISLSAAVAGDGVVTGGVLQEFRTGYLGNGGQMYSNRSVSQTDIFVEYNGLRAEAWLSTNFNGEFRENDGSEMDWILGYNRDIEILNGINLDVGIAYFDCSKLFAGTTGDTVELFFEAAFKTDTDFTPFIRGEFNFATDGGNCNELFVGTRHQWKINEEFSINSKIAGVFDLGDGYSDAGTVLLIETGIGWKLSESLTLNPLFVKVTTPLIGSEDRDGTEAVIGTSLSWSF